MYNVHLSTYSSTLSGSRLFLVGLAILPDTLNSLSDAELVAQTHRYFFTTTDNVG